MIDGIRPDWRARLAQLRTIPAIGQMSAHIRSCSPSDRAVFFVLGALVALASLISLYSLEQTFLVRIPAYGGSLTEGTVGNPQFINPLLAISDADRDLSTLTYAGLMGLTGDGTLAPVLAESYAVSDDGKIYTFTLRKNATFTDGTPISASDVVFTVKKAQDPAIKSPEYANWSGVGVTAVDERTVRFTLSKPYAPFLGITTLGILPAHLWQRVSSTEFPFSTLETNPVGNGPFMVASVSRNASGLIESVLLTKNPAYVLGRPYLDSIRFKFYANAEDVATALTAGTIDTAYGLSAGSKATRLLSAPYARVFGVFWNASENQVYANAEVRKALSLAIDRHAIVTAALGGYATPIMGPVPPGDTDIAQTPLPPLADTLTPAVQTLTNAGWSYDSTKRAWRDAKGKQTIGTITIRTSNVPEMKSVASAVKRDWEKLGISVEIELYEPGDLSQNVIRPRKYGALLYGMVIGRDQDLYAFWDSQERNDPGLNIALYVNKTVDALLEDARSNPDKSVRTADLQKIEDTISADYPAAFLYAPSFLYTVPSDLEGVLLPQIITPADRFASVASWYRFTDSVWPLFVKHS